MLKIHDLQIQRDRFNCHFNLEIATAEKVALVGESGSGKSTLLNLVAGFLLPQKGSIHWNDQDFSALLPADRPVTTMFQDHNLFSHLDVWHNIALGINPAAKLDKNQQQDLREILRDVGLEGMEKRLPETLSGGQQQRVALARSLLRKQPLLLLDEPFSALDADTREKMLLLTANLVDHYQRTLLLVTHHPEDADLIGARTVRISNGEVLVTG